MPAAIAGAVVDHDDLVGEAVGLFQVLGREQHRGTVGHEPPDHAPQLEPTPRVETRRRLVEIQERRASYQARREVEPPAHSARVRLHELPGGLRRSKSSSSRIARLLASEALRPSKRPIMTRLSLPEKQLVDRRVLPGQADHAPHLGGSLDDVVPADCGATGVELQQCGQHPDRRRLAGAVGPEQPEDGSLACDHVDAVDRSHRAEGLTRPSTSIAALPMTYPLLTLADRPCLVL